MPLSEHEKRLLDEIEQTLLIDDPVLASSLRSARPSARTRTFVALAVTALIAGFVLLVIGLRLHGIAGTALGVAGFAFIVAGSDFSTRAFGRVRPARRRAGRSPGGA